MRRTVEGREPLREGACRPAQQTGPPPPRGPGSRAGPLSLVGAEGRGGEGTYTPLGIGRGCSWGVASLCLSILCQHSGAPGEEGGPLGVSGASAHMTVHSPQRLLSFPTSCPRFLPGPVSSLRRGLLPSPPQVSIRQGSVLHTRVPKASLRRAAPGPGCVWAACRPLSSRVDRKSQLGRLDRMQRTGVGAAQVCFLADLEAGSQGRGSPGCVLSSLLGVWTPSRLLTCSPSCV